MEAGYKSIAPLAGSIEVVQGDGAVTTFAALFAYVRNQGDGWAYALNHLERASASLYADAQEQAMSPLFMAQMQTLGKRVGELHAVLARPTANPDFRPEPLEAKDTEEWTQTLLHEVDVTFEILTRRLAALPDTVQALARALLDSRQAVVERSRALITRTPRDLLKTRYHGDLHLGQALLTADDFLITDFEGEPARSMDERRRKSSPLRDVAGMLRSFDYARVVATDRVVAQRPDLRGRVEPVFEAWHGAACAAFMRGYRTGVGGARSVPSDERDLNRLIEFFAMEKALYELRYEIENRPHWLGAPARALLALIGREERAAA
jgi:maltose alpha-D-glucosyltransferase/alpha-amylase